VRKEKEEGRRGGGAGGGKAGRGGGRAAGSWELQLLRMCDNVGETQAAIKLLLAKRVKKSTTKLVLTLLMLGYPKFLFYCYIF
jgi:hypothetical protein